MIIKEIKENNFYKVFKENGENFIEISGEKMPVTVNFYDAGSPIIICGECKCKLRTYRNRLYVNLVSFSLMAALKKYPEKTSSLSFWLKESNANKAYWDFRTYPAFYY